MGHSSLLGTDLAPSEAAGRDTAALGPGDNSDSGSDMAGLDEELDDGDPSVPVDVALRDDGQRAGMSGDAMSGSSSDASGTGERRSAGADAGREAADISTDRIFTPGSEGEDGDEDEDPDLAFVDQAEVGDVLDEEDGADDEDDGERPRSGKTGTGSAQSRLQGSSPHPPGRPSPEPDGPEPVGPDDEEDIPSDDDDDDEHAPGRT